MKRRTILKSIGASAILLGTSMPIWLVQRREPDTEIPETQIPNTQIPDIQILINHDPEIPPSRVATTKIRKFDLDYDDDLFLTADKHNLLKAIVTRMGRLQRHIGHANFSLLSFDDMLDYARRFTVIGAFTLPETEFLEELFNNDAASYGFFGTKVTTRLTENINRKDTFKVPHSGNYLYRGESLKMYYQLKKDVGETLVLTSGIRGIVKQMYLFMAKLIEAQGNMSRASRSLAPPGHSYHGIGDFDVGQTGLGRDNFTSRFAESEAFNKLKSLEYVDIRYTSDNRFGVRYEPWHIKVVS